jgi:hypothetical protein
MFLLSRSELPVQPDRLAKALEDGLRVFVSRTQPMVTVRGNDVRALEAISINLSDARLDFFRRPIQSRILERTSALSAAEFSVMAEPLSIFGGEVFFQLHASDVEFVQAKQPDDKLLLLLHRASSGSVRMEATRADLEKLIARGAEKLAQKQGVTIADAKLALTQTQPRILAVNIVVAARKLLFRPVLNLSGRISISEELVATISDLKCSGDGPIATLACAAIAPQFRRIEQRAFPLSALPLGEVQLHDVTFDFANDRLVIEAKFGERSLRA